MQPEVISFYIHFCKSLNDSEIAWKKPIKNRAEF